ncbi:hypothetical protein [Vibrio lentus]|uniref:Uncharacterized protein n=1 Tax=Vibrio lentus TaxID=136468 RepID=A0A2N7BQI3_9VIBR|nr:hypothetical protein [Vibrio lentus]PME55126.1 hypothetical protein BCV34_21070 [Vibrio lentus]PME61221.1 hypothetical protein BCV30_11910 [Vibrio lentus]PME90315.1 hypothetical protein BCV27_22415 [Vibrio lentus]PMH94115.1 hypothetical protein BCU56_20670 [Vibrio lentus]PMI10815.1 hypothetical protein BCU53_22670 [Vibrio lentus]
MADSDAGIGGWKKQRLDCNDSDTGLCLITKVSPLPTGLSLRESLKNFIKEEKQMKRLKDYELTLFPDGLLTGPYASDQLRIKPSQKREFNSFLRSVPKPTWLEETLDIRAKIFTWFFLAMIFLAPTVWKLLS